jgi:hypothetical protein
MDDLRIAETNVRIIATSASKIKRENKFLPLLRKAVTPKAQSLVDQNIAAQKKEHALTTRKAA